MKICPKCGAEYSFIDKKVVGNSTYYYAVHYTGKGKRKKCYLGAKAYKYVSKMHEREGLVFTGLLTRIESLDTLKHS